MKGGPFGEKIPEKKSRSAEKNWMGDALVSPGMVCYAGKQEKPFWFSSLDQIVQFGAIIFCRTFENYFGQFVWIEKKKSHYNSHVSLREAPTKNKTFFRFHHLGGKPISGFVIMFICFLVKQDFLSGRNFKFILKLKLFTLWDPYLGELTSENYFR